MAKRISELVSATSPLSGEELIEISRLSSTVKITAATISALSSDRSFNDSANGFISAGFMEGDSVHVTGFTGSSSNNIYSGRITLLSAGKMQIGGDDGSVIVDDAAGESVTISRWETRRASSDDIAARYTVLLPIAVSNEISPITAGVSKVGFPWPTTGKVVEVMAALNVAQSAGNIVTVDINNNGTTVLSTKLTIDNGERTSLTAASAPVLSGANVVKGEWGSIDIDQVGESTVAAGLKVYIWVRPG